MSDDTDLLDMFDNVIMGEGLKIEIERIYLVSGSWSWQVRFVTHSMYEHRNQMTTGGGRTVREALREAVTQRVTERLTRS